MEYRCDVCNYFSNRKYDVDRHRNSKKHLKNVEEHTNKMEITKSLKMEPKRLPKRLPNTQKKCDFCDSFFSKKANLNKHLLKFHKIDNRKFTVECVKGSKKAPSTKVTSCDNFPKKSARIRQNCQMVPKIKV